MAKDTVMGVYRLYDPEGDVSFVGFTRSLEGIQKRLRFELTLNACSYRPLQEHYNACKGEMRFEVLEEYHPADGLSEEEVDAHLQALFLRHKARLNGRRLQVEIQ